MACLYDDIYIFFVFSLIDIVTNQVYWPLGVSDPTKTIILNRAALAFSPDYLFTRLFPSQIHLKTVCTFSYGF